MLPKNETVFQYIFLNNFKNFLEAHSLLKICKIVLKYTLKWSQLISSSDNKKILLTTRNFRLDSGRYATKYYYSHLTWGGKNCDIVPLYRMAMSFQPIFQTKIDPTTKSLLFIYFSRQITLCCSHLTSFSVSFSSMGRKEK
jgi:hypothetical protein